MKIQILPSVLEDIDRGRIFYERIEDGLGKYFMDSIFSDIDFLGLYGGIHHKVFGYYRMLAKRFPFVIYYRMRGKAIEIWRILDCRQDPNKIRKDLK